nr:hydrogenase 4 subunit B [Nitrospirales bacterium]
TLLTLAYFLKLFERVFRDRSAQQPPLMREVPLAVRISLGATSVGVIVLGVMSDHIVSFLLKNAIPPGL